MWVEPRDAHSASEPQGSVFVAHGRVLIEFVALQTILDGVVVERLLLHVELRQARSTAHPEVALSIGLRGEYVVAWQAFLRFVGLVVVGLGIEHDKTLIGAKADFCGRTTCNAINDDRIKIMFGCFRCVTGMKDDKTVIGAEIESIVQGIVAEGSAPVASRDNLLMLEYALFFVISQQSLTHGGSPKRTTLVLLEVIDVARRIYFVFDGNLMINTRACIDDATTLTIGAHP